MVFAVFAEHGGGVADFIAHNDFGQAQDEAGIAMLLKLGDAQRNVFGLRRGELAEQFTGVSENGEFDAVFQHFLQGLGSDLHVAEEHDVFNIGAGKIEQNFIHSRRAAFFAVRLFAEQQAVAAFAQDGVLFDEVEGSHVSTPKRKSKRQKAKRKHQTAKSKQKTPNSKKQTAKSKDQKAKNKKQEVI
jgi:hypothetical protein